MAKFLSFRDGGKTDEEGIAKPFADIFTGEVKAGFTTTQLGSPGMGVAVAEGSAFIDTGNGYPYHVWSDSSENVTIATADGSNPRWDLIVAYVDLTEVDDTDPNNPDAFKLVAVAGTPAGSPAEPNGAAIQAAIGASNPYIILARVVVGAGVTTITNANISDRRTMVTTNVNAGTNKVVTASVADSAITTAKINNGAVTGKKQDSASLVTFNYQGSNANADASSATFADWGTGSATIAVPTWATLAICTVSITGITQVTNASNTRVRFLIGTDTHTSTHEFGINTASDKTNVTIVAPVTLTSTGNQTFKIQALRINGTGTARMQTSQPAAYVSGQIMFR